MKQNKILHFYQIDAVFKIKNLITYINDYSLKSITLNYLIYILFSLFVNIFFQDMFVEKLSSFLKKFPSLFVYAPIIEAHFKFMPYYLGALVFLHFLFPLMLLYTSYFYSLAYKSNFKNMFKIWFIAIQLIPIIIVLPYFIGIFILLSIFITFYINYFLSKMYQKPFWHVYFLLQQLLHIFLFVLYVFLIF